MMMTSTMKDRRSTTEPGAALRELYAATATAYERITAMPFEALSADERARWLLVMSEMIGTLQQEVSTC